MSRILSIVLPKNIIPKDERCLFLTCSSKAHFILRLLPRNYLSGNLRTTDCNLHVWSKILLRGLQEELNTMFDIVWRVKQ
jgi:hypothetical protein